VVASAARLAVSVAFLTEFLSHGRAPLLSSLTAPPSRRPVAGAGADIQLVSGQAGNAPLVLVHGFAPEGNRDPRLLAAATLLARAGFAVAVPTVPGLTRGRLRPDDADPVVAALALRPGPTTMVAVSVGAGPAFLAAADPRVSGRVSTLVVLGGYASARELVRFFLTGEYAYGRHRGRVAHDPEVVRAFVAANADLVPAPLGAGLAAGNRASVDVALETLAPLLEALSPERVAPRLQGRLVLIHGRGDPAVPFTETLRLAAARPAGTTVVLVGVVDHVGGAARSHGVRDLLTLGAATYAMMARR
jgi:pimeloyl-ACP methyl ester carboxylesterase